MREKSTLPELATNHNISQQRGPNLIVTVTSTFSSGDVNNFYKIKKICQEERLNVFLRNSYFIIFIVSFRSHLLVYYPTCLIYYVTFPRSSCQGYWNTEVTFPNWNILECQCSFRFCYRYITWSRSHQWPFWLQFAKWYLTRMLSVL